MSSEILEQLRETFLFRGMPEEALRAVASQASIRKVPAGETLIREGDQGDSLFMIHEGWVKIVTKDNKGGELIINKCGPGELIGEMAILDKAPRSATVVAISPSEVFELNRDAFQDLLNQRPDVSLSLIRAFSSRLRFSTTYIQKAIEWTQRIAAGDYSVLEDSRPALGGAGSNEDKAGQLLSEFFKMAKSVKAREDELRKKVEKLALQIDENRRRQEFEEITGTDFYSNLKAQAKALRDRRRDS
jgi:CRP-like cAMP-binding protein